MTAARSLLQWRVLCEPSPLYSGDTNASAAMLRHKGPWERQVDLDDGGCYLEWHRWSADFNMGLLHQMSSLSCALSDAHAQRRTLLLPTHVCGHLHNERMHGQSPCVELNKLFDLNLLSELIPARLGFANHRFRKHVLAFQCPSVAMQARFPCSGNATLVTRAVDDLRQYWYSVCGKGAVHMRPMLTSLVDSLGDTSTRLFDALDAAARLRQGKSPTSAPDENSLAVRALTLNFLRSGLYFAQEVKEAAAAIRKRMGPYVLVHVRRGDRIHHFGSAPGVPASVRLNLTSAKGVARALRMWFPPNTTVYVAASESSPKKSFHPLASEYRLFFAEDFTNELAAVRSSTYLLYAVELLLAVGADAFVETFASQLDAFQYSCFPAIALEASLRRGSRSGWGGPGIRITQADPHSSSYTVNGVAYGRACVRNTPCRDTRHRMYLVGHQIGDAMPLPLPCP